MPQERACVKFSRRAINALAIHVKHSKELVPLPDKSGASVSGVPSALFN